VRLHVELRVSYGTCGLTTPTRLLMSRSDYDRMMRQLRNQRRCQSFRLPVDSFVELNSDRARAAPVDQRRTHARHRPRVQLTV
jgi:hypothetical protein